MIDTQKPVPLGTLCEQWEEEDGVGEMAGDTSEVLCVQTQFCLDLAFHLHCQWVIRDEISVPSLSGPPLASVVPSISRRGHKRDATEEGPASVPYPILVLA